MKKFFVVGSNGQKIEKREDLDRIERTVLDVYLVLEEKLEFSSICLIFSPTLDRPKKFEWYIYQLF